MMNLDSLAEADDVNILYHQDGSVWLARFILII